MLYLKYGTNDSICKTETDLCLPRGRGEGVDICPDKTCRWPVSTWKDPQHGKLLGKYTSEARCGSARRIAVKRTDHNSVAECVDGLEPHTWLVATQGGSDFGKRFSGGGLVQWVKGSGDAAASVSAQIQSLAQKLPYSIDAAIKKKKN